MRLTTAVVAAATLTLLVPSLSHAQAPPPPGPSGPGGAGPGGPPPPPGMGGPGFGKPLGWTWGLDLSLGAMKSEQAGSITCASCDFQPVSFGFGGWFGLQLSPVMQLAADFRVTTQLIDSTFFDDAYLSQGTFMATLKYWVGPKLWVQGGLGGATLFVTVDEAGWQSDETVDSGGAGMLAIGYEIVTGPFFSMSLNARVVSAHYNGLGDSIQSVMFGIDFNGFNRHGIRRY